MPSATTSIERLVFEGPVGLAGAVLLGILLVTLCGVSLWRESAILGLRKLLLFWGTRTLAVATVLWLLLAPHQVSIETSTTKRAIVLVADVSDSMQTVDPAGTAEELRWSLATESQHLSPLTAASDRAVAAAGQARLHLGHATNAIRQHAGEAELLLAINSAHRALLQTGRQLTAAARAAQPDTEILRLVMKVQSLLAAAEFEEFDRLANTLERGRQPTQKGWHEGLADLDYRLSGVESVLHELARQAAHIETNRIMDRTPQLLAAQSQQSRLQHETRFLARLSESVLDQLHSQVDVHVRSFAESVYLNSDTASIRSPAPRSAGTTAGPVPQTVARTNLTTVLEQLQRDRQEQPLAAVFLLTDVGHNAAAENPRTAAAALAGTPVYVVPIGNPGFVRDIQLQSVSAPAVAMRNDDIVIEARLEAHECDAEACTVQLLHDGEVIDFREITFEGGFATRTVRFEQRMPTVGVQQFQLAVTPVTGESTTENNYRDFEVQVTRSDIKLLLADEHPRWEYRYLAQLFRRDPKVECDELLFHPRLIATGRRQETGTVPITVDEWDQYDVVLLGDLRPDHLSIAAQESLVNYLAKRGGTVVVIAGSESMPHAYRDHPLQGLLPVVPVDNPPPVDSGGYAFRVTAEGENHHALMIAETDDATRTAWEFVNKFAPLHSLSLWRQPRPTAHTLISAAPRSGLSSPETLAQNAFLCWQPVGRGRIVYLSGPETYRLRFLRGDRLHFRFWGQLLRWAIASDLAVGTKFVRIKTDKSRYETGDAVELSVQLTNQDGEPLSTSRPVQVRLTTGDSEQQVDLSSSKDIPGEYAAALHTLGPGVYRAEPMGSLVDELQAASADEPAATSFTVQAEVPLELIDTRCNRALAQQIAAVTGGQVLPPTAIEEVLSLTNLEPIISERIERRPLWLQWKFLWLVFGCLQIEWLVRKWHGLS